VIDKRPGTIHVPVTDLNRDGQPDFVALISQEHETIVAFINGGGDFRQETIYQAPHPAYGSSGIQLADMDGDDDLDVLYTNGDGFDEPFLVRPYHGVQWLENEGRFPFSFHRLARMPGVQRAVAGDVDGDRDQDIVAVSYLPPVVFPREQLDLDSVVLLEQIEKGVFVSHGPGDPAAVHYAIDLIKGLIGRVPIFGICLGHQLLGLALGADTFKLKFGHRGTNQPVKNLGTGRVEITSQNHGFAVDPVSLERVGGSPTHTNLNDGTLEGFVHRDHPILAVQYHPEAAPGPHDATYLFECFVQMVRSGRAPSAEDMATAQSKH
jgi:anthranilate/para-aminobenzoate synthase component II